jgi:stage II sporulation protein M
VSYTGSTSALGADRLGSIPSTPTRKPLKAVCFFRTRPAWRWTKVSGIGKPSTLSSKNSRPFAKIMIKRFYNENKPWVDSILRLFVVAIFLGALAYLIKPDLMNQIIGIFQQKFGPEPVRNVSLAKEIFLQNATACLLALVGGIIFGISSLVVVFFNGFIIGFVVLSLLLLPGNIGSNLWYLILGLLPHGIFELPAFLISSALGLRLGLEWIQKDSRGKRYEIFRNNLRRIAYAIPWLAIMLLIAAFVEVSQWIVLKK